MKLLSTLFLVLFSFVAFADNHKSCTYNEWAGKLVFHYEAHEPKTARGWAPTELVICKDDEGLYAIVTHVAIGLGLLANPPLRIAPKADELEEGKRYALLFNESTSFDEREAAKHLDKKPVEAVIVFTGTKKQILVTRRELEGTVTSNTLFLKEEGAKLSEAEEIGSKK